MSFTALGAYEVPSLWGPPLIYGRIYEVALQRPDKLAVHHGRRRAADRVLRRRQGHDELPSRRKPRRRSGRPAVHRRDAREALWDRRHLLPLHRRDRREPVEGHSDRTDGRLLRRRVDARRRHRDRRRRLRVATASSSRCGSAKTTSSRRWPGRCTSTTLCSCGIRCSSRTGSSTRRSRPEKFTTTKAAARRQDSVQPSEDEVRPSGGCQPVGGPKKPVLRPKATPNPQ